MAPGLFVMLDASDRAALLTAAHHSIEQSVAGGNYTPENISPDSALHKILASFVTLKRHDVLRGCIGSLEAYRPLLDDVIANARAAALQDPRFPPLTAIEMDSLHIEISVLSDAEPVHARDRAELLLALKPYVDGLVVQTDRRRATFLPAVWSSLPDPGNFYDALMRKAGLAANHWSTDLKFFRYHTESFQKQS